jgi:hypothetical protein
MSTDPTQTPIMYNYNPANEYFQKNFICNPFGYMSAGNIRTACMREYRKRKQLVEDNCNNVPKRTKLDTERQREYRETHKNLSAEYMHNYRKRKAQENKTPQASTSTDLTTTPVIYCGVFMPCKNC